MQRTTPILFLAGGVLAAGLALGQAFSDEPVRAETLAQDPAPKPADAALLSKVTQLEQRVATLEAWIADQQAQAKLTLAALKEAEDAGFTAGINPKSREVLLAAWRTAATKAQGTAPTGGSDRDPRRSRGERE